MQRDAGDVRNATNAADATDATTASLLAVWPLRQLRVLCLLRTFLRSLRTLPRCVGWKPRFLRESHEPTAEHHSYGADSIYTFTQHVTTVTHPNGQTYMEYLLTLLYFSVQYRGTFPNNWNFITIM